MTVLNAAEVRRLVGPHLAVRTPGAHVSTLGAGGYDLVAGRSFLTAVLEAGLGAPTWPGRFGGRDAGAEEVALIDAVLDQFDVPDLYPYRVGLRMVGPTLLEFGSPDQQARWLRPIAAGAEIWCQMFSEPDAGSDLANLATAAVPDGPTWVLDGQKVWTSRAAYADWGICLARTDPDVEKHRGLTMFAVAMDTPGVDVRPLVQMNGDDHFSEVFLTGVRVPDTGRIGPSRRRVVGGGDPARPRAGRGHPAGPQPAASATGCRPGWPTWPARAG